MKSKLNEIISLQDKEKVIHSLVTLRLDYCNPFYAGLILKMLQKLLQKAAARMMTVLSWSAHLTLSYGCTGSQLVPVIIQSVRIYL